MNPGTTDAPRASAPEAGTSLPQVLHTTPRTRDVMRALQFALRQVVQSQAPMMAASLAFRTLFGLVPVLVVATIVTRAVLGDEFFTLLRHAIEAVGLDAVRAGEGVDAMPLGQWLEERAREAAEINLSAIGAVGALAVVFSAVWTMVAIEASFNTIFRAPSGRPFVRRILVYWFVITAGPVLFAAIPLAFRSLSDLVGADTTAALALGKIVSTIGGFLSVWTLLAAAYATVPNAKVNLRSAVIGAFVSTLLIEIGKRFLGASLAGSFAASRLYGSLGLVPIFMLWVYLMWLVVLLGLQVAAILQGFTQHGRALAAGVGAPDVFEPATAIPCFQSICARYAKGKTASVDTLVRECGVTPVVARALLEILEKRSIVRRADGGFVPSRPAESVLQREVLAAGFALSDGGAEAHTEDAVAVLRRAQLASLGESAF